jgi:probable HAF family extracellular repeat protein
MVAIASLGGTISRGYAINDAGQVAGFSTLVDGSIRAFRYNSTGGVTTNIGTLGGTQSRARGINAAGRVVGYSYDGSAVLQTMRWSDWNTNNAVDAGELVAIASLATPSYALDINDSGAIVGYFTTGGNDHAYFRDTTGMVDLHGLLSGATSSQANAIDSAGMVCGQYVTGGVTRAFMYDSVTKVMTDLNTLPGASGWLLASARDIDDGGMITGWGTIGGQTHAFIAFESEAAPEPMTLMLVGSGALALFGMRRRKTCGEVEVK